MEMSNDKNNLVYFLIFIAVLFVIYSMKQENFTGPSTQYCQNRRKVRCRDKVYANNWKCCEECASIWDWSNKTCA
jgi:hypothetical protein